MKEFVIMAAIVALAVGVVLSGVRMIIGPTIYDRVLAFDTAGLDVIGAILLVEILFDTGVFMDVVLVIALLGFLGTITLTAYLEGRLGD
ncbi:monovalent cation/H+ antiporter complex subunit F [Tautonia rosea]|uniref:monovalent cation/H+ antiporter complex subunit F n=1 Tax=Tautonia rosea TaxID=2728037 RepID=UPI0019D271AE|nr:monovalent cation/H+ antiporter complex subunit F [Tautonia rosea]